MRYVALIVGASLALLAAPLGCTATIVPPRAPADPVPVFVVVQAWTSSLVIPSGGALMRYAYGDWHYYALGRNTPANGARALLWPSQATLGRAVLSGPAEAARLRQRLNADAVHELRVARGSAVRLVADLERAYGERRATEVHNAPYGLRFVRHPDPYTYFHNSNHVVADWLRQLGCHVRGPTFGSSWRVREGA